MEIFKCNFTQKNKTQYNKPEIDKKGAYFKPGLKILAPVFNHSDNNGAIGYVAFPLSNIEKFRGKSEKSILNVAKQDESTNKGENPKKQSTFKIDERNSVTSKKEKNAEDSIYLAVSGREISFYKNLIHPSNEDINDRLAYYGISQIQSEKISKNKSFHLSETHSINTDFEFDHFKLKRNSDQENENFLNKLNQSSKFIDFKKEKTKLILEDNFKSNPPTNNEEYKEDKNGRIFEPEIKDWDSEPAVVAFMERENAILERSCQDYLNSSNSCKEILRKTDNSTKIRDSEKLNRSNIPSDYRNDYDGDTQNPSCICFKNMETRILR
ncbi:hypothetical protein AYI68_g8327 [Smittium mucronatum]|uniref:Uncharacterized protein n=1 Tax=Smittium mucronatum TaxID=133383 RepID=A0A1R0GL79_9FUNG|nr:hypothetical protein AYI68_g8327 [Smittium mucronatum]